MANLKALEPKRAELPDHMAQDMDYMLECMHRCGSLTAYFSSTVDALQVMMKLTTPFYSFKQGGHLHLTGVQSWRDQMVKR